MIYVYVDQGGYITESHNDDTVNVLPEAAIEISMEEWPDRLNYKYINGEKIPIEVATIGEFQ